MTSSPGSADDTATASRHAARLSVRTAPPNPQAAVVLLHGGRADGLAAPPWINLPALRLRFFGTAILRARPRNTLLLASVRYRRRGWNGPLADPVHDARDALDELGRLSPGLPVVLVGHSMGGRAALRAAAHPSVRGVIALAPWCPAGEPASHLRDKTVVMLHDPRDRVTRADLTWAFARRARAQGADVHAVKMPHGGHTMLHGAQGWHHMTALCAAAVLDGTPPPHPIPSL
ncbi:alpha/beta fold hydrolase [Streptomyces sp. NBC_00442]|uniref:alpha/beta fold hydrolase n=1 Tax=Streptomyces sp. NBC_00442 TaxID=2903651 RepID=UPI002E1EDA36